MPAASHQPEVTAYLLRDALKHIVHLKALSAYSQHIRSHYFSHGSSAGVLFLYPTRVTTYESVKYPETQYVVLISSDSPSITEQMLDHIPEDCNFLLKLMNPEDKAIVERKFPLKRVTSFLSYTHSPAVNFPGSERVTVSRELDEKLLPFYRANGYERDEVEGYFKSGSAISFAVHEIDEPVSACMAYQNHGDIWEICGLYTINRARRKGYARNVVETALNRLLANGHIPRYQMDEKNIASRTLAESLGLTLTIEVSISCRHRAILPRCAVAPVCRAPRSSAWAARLSVRACSATPRLPASTRLIDFRHERTMN